MGDDCGLSWWATCIYKALIRRIQEYQSQKDVTMGTEVQVMPF